MFGFGDRKKYNGQVDLKLINELGIATRDNEKFPGILKYLEIIDLAWNAKMTVDEGALYIATLYFCGIVRAGCRTEAEMLRLRLMEMAVMGLERRTVSHERWDKFSAAISSEQYPE